VKSRNLWYAGLMLLLVMVVAVRVRLLNLPLERDEGEFAYAGQLMLQGIPPYQLAFNMKMPGIYAAYAAIMAVFGQTTAGIHLGILVVNLATAVLLFFLARRWLQGPAVPVCCAVYLLVSLSPALRGLAGHATHLVVLHALGGLLLLLRARQSGKALTLFLSGLLFGLAFLCKQPGLFFGFFGIAILMWDARTTWPASWRSCARNISWLCAGMALPLALTCLILWRAGTFERFWFWTVPYAQVYGRLQTLTEGLDRLDYFFAFGTDRWFFIAGIFGLFVMFRQGVAAERQFFFTAFFFFSFCATAAGWYFREHYFLLLLPVICLLIGDVITRLGDALAQSRAHCLRALPIALVLAGCLWQVWYHRAIWFELPPDRAIKNIYLAEAFVECREIGNYIRAHSSPEDRVEVIGSEPEIYFDARRRSVSGYIYVYDLVRNQPHAAEMRREFMDDTEKAKPRFIVLVNVGSSWMSWKKTSQVQTFIDWTTQYPAKFYELIGLAAVYQTNSAYFWDPDGIAKNINAASSVLLFRRK
jgi:4-amino-4-deoxy-L-arabinose transferase-like glycosyltransferase